MHLEKVSVDWMVTSVNNESQNANLSVFLSDDGISNFFKNMDIYKYWLQIHFTEDGNITF